MHVAVHSLGGSGWACMHGHGNFCRKDQRRGVAVDAWLALTSTSSQTERNHDLQPSLAAVARARRGTHPHRRRLYGDTYPALLQRFRRERGGSLRGPLTMGEWKAFIYWLFKSRLSRSDQARTASDTHKGLTYLATVMPAVRACVTLPVPELLS